MNTKIRTALFLAGFLAVTAIAKESVTLRINYSNKQHCVYGIEYTSQGEFKQKGVISKKNTGVNCIMSAIVAEQNRVTVKVDTVGIKSDFYDSVKIAKLHESVMKTTYSLTTVDGYPAIDTSIRVPEEDYMEWDLYRQLVKLLPSVPDKSIRPGYTWEQTIVLPMQTARGTVPCELYRFYTFKKRHGDTAMISWNFRYAPAENATDSTNPLKEIPIGGKGSGTALISISDNCILSADMGFSTPIAVINDITVTWRERAVFTLKRCK
jgi:hypothetical protein